MKNKNKIWSLFLNQLEENIKLGLGVFIITNVVNVTRMKPKKGSRSQLYLALTFWPLIVSRLVLQVTKLIEDWNKSPIEVWHLFSYFFVK
jgi:hypothetical protein